jgi:lipid A 3-O-deacylase
MQRAKTLLLFAFLLAAAYPAAAQERLLEDNKSIFNVVFENDIFAGSDRGYTNGIRFAWISSEEEVPDWARWTANNLLPLAPEGKKRISIAAGQSMFAPGDLSRTDLIVNDRPYAGWLYGSVGMVSDTGKRLDNAVLTVGVVGPWALAEPVQKFVHHVVNSPQPRGWDNQLDNEPGITFTYERKWRGLYEASPFGVGVDVMPHVGMNLGNVNTDASLGATLRVGYDLPADYGPPRIRPSLPGSDFFIPTQDLGGYFFASVEERAVARDIFLDGNTFQDGPSVDKKILVSSLQLGVAMTYGASRLSYTHVFMTKQFDTEQGHPVFGALTYSYRF